MTHLRPSAAGRVIAEVVGAAALAIAVAVAYGVHERERIAGQLDGNEVENDGDSVIAVVQVLIGAGLFVTLCVAALLMELALRATRRRVRR